MESTITPTQLHAETEPAPPLKDRRTRRAMGQRNPKLRGGLARLGAVSRKLAGYVETGPQRAQRRAAARGLTVGAPVRITHPGHGFNVPYAAENRPRPMPKPRPLAPLDFGQRCERYAANWGSRHPLTPRQQRRARHKANHAAAPFGRKAPAPLGGWSL